MTEIVSKDAREHRAECLLPSQPHAAMLFNFINSTSLKSTHDPSEQHCKLHSLPFSQGLVMQIRDSRDGKKLMGNSSALKQKNVHQKKMPLGFKVRDSICRTCLEVKGKYG